MAIRDIATGALSGALSAAPTGNPWLIGGSALAGGIGGGLQRRSKFSPVPYRRALRKLRRQLRMDADRDANELSSQLGSAFAARNISGGVKEGIIAGNRRLRQQAADSQIAQLEYNTEIGIADAQLAEQLQSDQAFNADIATVLGQGSAFVTALANPSTNDPPALRKLRTALNMENVDPIDLKSIFGDNAIDIGGGLQVTKDSWMGKAFSQNSEWLTALGEEWQGGLKGLYDLLKGVK